MFSHMAMMYAYALYQRGHPEAGYTVMEKIYQHCQNFAISRMYPGIPEYIGQDGRGYYFYLTGSASWYMFTLITQVFGIRGIDGDLLIEPKLVLDQFDQHGIASIHSHFAGRQLVVELHNVGKLQVDQYKISNVRIDDAQVSFDPKGRGAKILREVIEDLSPDEAHKIKIELS